jgi:glucan-binding YG repeat protein
VRRKRMHRRIRKIISAVLIVGIISCVGTSDEFIFGSIKAYASTYKSAIDGELNSLTVTRSTGSEIKLLDSYYGDEVSLTAKKDYYIELKGADGLQISADVKGKGYVVKQFTSADKTEKGEDVGEYINIDSGSENIYLRTYKSKEAYKEACDNKDLTDCEKTYIIHVRKPVVNSDKEEDKDYAYLKNLYISNGDIVFSKNKYSYNVNVGEDIKEILVRATPEDKDDLIEINGKSVEEADNYEKTVSLDEGNNQINIEVENNDDDETYTLNVYRGKESDSNTSLDKKIANTISSGQSLRGKYNSWQNIDGKLQYLDGTGEPLKSKLWLDVNTGKKYYLDKDGYAVTGWLYLDNNWYYFDENGQMKTDWIFSNGNWYYLNKSGVMQTGWLQDTNGKWYYLDSTGKMADN